jgi:sigma-B regulation protein RsbU (phosphoserine phosphatase)
LAAESPWLALPAEFPAIVALTDPEGSLAWIRGAPVERLEMAVGPTEYIAGLFTRPAAIFLETHVWPTLRREGRVSEIALPLRARDGGELPCLVNACLLEGPNGPCCLWLFFPTLDRLRFERELIAARSASQDLVTQLDQLAQTDPLTGLGNRRALQSAFETWLRHGDLDGTKERGALLMVDADHFKAVNDQWGHDAGDQVLVRIAAKLRASIRRSDCVVRLGGEEFALWLPGGGHEVASRVAEQIHERMRNLRLREDEAPLSVSIGIALLSGQGDMTDLAALLKRADAALYAAKTKGRNRTCWADVPPG